jgi:hypothetical protein
LPWLFNIFVDNLLYKVNALVTRPLICLFYTDDSVIIAYSKIDLGKVLYIVEEWSR